MAPYVMKINYTINFYYIILQYFQKKYVFIRKIGSHLLSQAVTSQVSSAVQGLTIVFGMGTGVSQGRIATKKCVNLHVYLK